MNRILGSILGIIGSGLVWGKAWVRGYSGPTTELCLFVYPHQPLHRHLIFTGHLIFTAGKALRDTHSTCQWDYQ